MDKHEKYQYAGFTEEEIAELERERLNLKQNSSLFSFNSEHLQFEPMEAAPAEALPLSANAASQSQYRAHLFLVIDNLHTAVGSMQKKNIPDAIIRAIFSDISLWFRYVKREFGMYGLSPRMVLWFNHHFAGKLYKLGLLQFEIASLDLEAGNLHIGDPILKVHIPEGERLLSDLCDQSFEKAGKFFSEILSYDFHAFIFDSWLCDREFMNLLPETSNIRKFVKRFELVRQSAVKDDEIYQRVFGGRAVQIGMVDYPLKTSLQKILYPFFMEGIFFGSGVGIIVKNHK